MYRSFLGLERKKEKKNRKNVCRWYDESSAMKRAYDRGLLDKRWIEEYCLNEGKVCVRKKRFEEEGIEFAFPSQTLYLKKDGDV